MKLLSKLFLISTPVDDIDLTGPEHNDYSLIDMSDINTKELIILAVVVVVVLSVLAVPWFVGAFHILKLILGVS